MQVKDVLGAKGQAVATVGPETNLAAVVKVLAERGVGALVVSEDGRRIAGIVSERDVVRALAREGAGLLDRPVSEIMTTDVHVCTPESSVDQLAGLMTERRIRHLPVLVDDALAGIVSIGDVVKSRITELETETQTMHEYIWHGR
jgi:CBS domain-containing protein